MAQSFLPFCAHCEKQIVVPNTSILFCSEKCKRKDQLKSQAIPIHQGFAMPSYSAYNNTPPFSLDTADGPPPKNYVQPLSPTPPRSVSAFDEYAYHNHHHLHHRSMAPYTPESSRPSSGTASPTGSPPNASNIYQPPRRPSHHRSMTAGQSLSSISTAVPVPTQYQYGGQRPLPPLHRPHPFSTSPRSIDLVTPYTSTPSAMASPRAEPITTPACSPDEDTTRRRSSYYDSERGGLRTLFDFDAIRGKPYVPEPVSAATSPDSRYDLTYSNGAPILARMSPTAVRMR